MTGVADPRYDEGYWEKGIGSNYVDYGDDDGWLPTVGILKKFAPPETSPRMLEIGCAKGWFLKAAVECGYDAEGVDVSKWALDHPAPGVKNRMWLADAGDIPFADGLFDLIVSWECLEHIYPNKIEGAFREMERLLAPGGLMVHRIGVLESDGDRSNHMHDVTHVTNEPSAWWRTVAADMGWVEHGEIEREFNAAFANRDWCGRFFAWSF